MGPLATADLFRKIVLNTDAPNDQEHLRVLIDNNTTIPDRTSALLNDGEDPVPQMCKSARLLEQMGAELLLIPCNTAHCFHKAVQQSVGVPVLHMIQVTAKVSKDQGIDTVGLLATDGTVQCGLYEQVCADYGITTLCPEEAEQKAVMDLIYNGVKAGRADYDASTVQDTINHLLQRGAKAIILGCTELPLAVTMYGLKAPFVDPTLELARAAIVAANGICVKEPSIA
ncbi:MAG: amino acid racemase [Clostridia bacterium]|nr:amino acid racemase [Clostridia bacterium]